MINTVNFETITTFGFCSIPRLALDNLHMEGWLNISFLRWTYAELHINISTQ